MEKEDDNADATGAAPPAKGAADEAAADESAPPGDIDEADETAETDEAGDE